MNLGRCSNGHFFDKEKYEFCPHCNNLSLVDPIAKIYNPLDGKWEFVALLGIGGFGRTYKLEDNTNPIRRYSVLKVISFLEDEAIENSKNDISANNTINQHTQKQLLDILNEVTLMYTLNVSKNIVNIFKHFVYKRDNEQAWDILIQMELLNPIDKYFNETPYTEKDIIKLFIDICYALKMCEKYNIVHQDIKPSNIFIDDNKIFKLGDFGSAKFLNAKESNNQGGHTRYYCAPEIYKGESASFSSDIYSLGITIYKYMNGNILPDTITSSECFMDDILLPPPQYASKSFADIILKSCALNIKHRYKNVSELLKDLMDLDETISPTFNKEAFISNSKISNKGVTDFFNNNIPLSNFSLPIMDSPIEEPSKIEDESTAPFYDITIPHTNSYINGKFNNKNNYLNFDTEPFVPNEQTSSSETETTAFYETETAIPNILNQLENSAEGRDISSNRSTSTHLKDSDNLGKRIFNRMINWVLFTCVFSLIPLIIYILFKYLFDVNISLIDKLATDFFYFGLTLSVVTIREMFSHKLWKKEKCIYLMALFIILLILILSTTFFGAMTMSEMNLVNSQLKKNYLLNAAIILGISSFLTGSFIQIWEEM